MEDVRNNECLTDEEVKKIVDGLLEEGYCDFGDRWGGFFCRPTSGYAYLCEIYNDSNKIITVCVCGVPFCHDDNVESIKSYIQGFVACVKKGYDFKEEIMTEEVLRISFSWL